jgi:hypothetical protein
MTRSIIKSITFTAAALAVTTLAGAAIPGMSAPAEAKIVIKHGHGHHGHHGYHFRHHYKPYYFANYGYGDCYWLKKKAIYTGSPYWWNRYHECKGGY